MDNTELVPSFEGTHESSLTLRLEKVDDKTMTVYIAGYIDTYNSNFFTQQMSKVIGHGYCNLIMNCSGLNYMSSTGVGSFTALLKEVKIYNGSIIIAALQPKVFEVFQLLGFSNFFTIAADQKQAIALAKPEDTVDVTDLEQVDDFPLKFTCPICDKNLTTSKPGRFRCPKCKNIITVNDKAEITTA